MVRYGVHDRPVASASDTTIPANEPIEPDPGVSVDGLLQDQLPPIEDDEYAPGNSRELAWALYAMGLEVDAEEVESVYRAMRKLYTNASGTKDGEPETEGVEVEVKKEARLKRRLREAMDDFLPYVEDEGEFEQQYARGRGYRHVPKSEVPWVEPVDDGSYSLEDIASELGYGAASGARQYIKRITDKIAAIISSMAGGKLDKLTNSAAEDYVTLMHDMDLIDDSELGVMLKDLDIVKEQPGFKYWLNNAYYAPALKAVENDARERIAVELRKAGVPEEIDQTVIGQVLGLSARKDATIQKRLQQKAGMEEDAAKQMTAKVRKLVTKLTPEFETPDDFVNTAMVAHDMMSRAKLKKLLTKSANEEYEYGEWSDS
jgi:uncharacterized protein YidB (DUF937 family)